MPGRRAISGASGALSTLITCAPICCNAQLHPPGLDPRSRQISPGPGRRPIRVKRFPQFQIGAARRADAILDELDLAIGKGVRGMRRREHRPGIQQGPRSERGRRRRCPEDERPRRDFRQLFLDQHCAPVEARRIDRPIALDRPQLCGCIRNRGDRNLLRVEPDIRGPCGGPWRPRSDQEATVPRIGPTELMVEFFDKALRGEVGSANSHGGQDHTLGLARRGTFAKLTGMAVDREIAELARAIARARRTVVFTGAGISTEFGHSRFPQPRRDLDPHGADRLLGFSRLGGGAV